jgi:hypothetical protein
MSYVPFWAMPCDSHLGTNGIQSAELQVFLHDPLTLGWGMARECPQSLPSSDPSSTNIVKCYGLKQN